MVLSVRPVHQMRHVHGIGCTLGDAPYPVSSRKIENWTPIPIDTKDVLGILCARWPDNAMLYTAH
jgi:hypothetical protein